MGRPESSGRHFEGPRHNYNLILQIGNKNTSRTKREQRPQQEQTYIPRTSSQRKTITKGADAEARKARSSPKSAGNLI